MSSAPIDFQTVKLYNFKLVTHKLWKDKEPSHWNPWPNGANGTNGANSGLNLICLKSAHQWPCVKKCAKRICNNERVSRVPHDYIKPTMYLLII